ncbi:MAG: hypothetical protein ABW139_00360 [Candidatus Thiodiazotropha sp. DIVDIV]
MNKVSEVPRESTPDGAAGRTLHRWDILWRVVVIDRNEVISEV